MIKKMITEIHAKADNICDDAYLEKLSDITGLKENYLRKHKVAEKLRRHIIFNDELAEAISEYAGRAIKITIEDEYGR